jgi:glucokinase
MEPVASPLPPGASQRQVNSQVVANVIIGSGPISRVEIARRAGLSKQTVAEIVRALEDAGWVAETGRVRGKVGRTAVTYQLNPRAGFVIGLDLGGTKLRGGITDLAGELLDEQVVATDARGGKHVLAQISQLSQQLAAAAEAPWERVQGVAIGSPGVLNPRTGAMDWAPNIPTFGSLHVQEELERELGVPVVIDNDVNMAVLGEHWQGLGQGCDDFVFLAVGTGVGMGVVVDGDIRRGAHGAAGEISYLPLGTDPLDPANQAKGAFEEASAGAAIVRRHAAIADRELSVPEIFAAAADGDAAALRVLDEEGRLLATALAAVVSIVDPALVVLGGGIGSREEMREPVVTWLERLVPKPPDVRTSVLGHRAGLVGALAVALRSAHRRVFAAPDGPARLTLPLPASPETVRSTS